MAQAERKAKIKPNGMTDDFGWEAVAGVAGQGKRCHRGRLRDPACFSKPNGKDISLRSQPIRLTVPSR